MANYKMITKELVEGYFIRAIDSLDKRLIGDKLKQVLKDDCVSEECINEILRYLEEQGPLEILRSSLSKKFDK